jgi:hypothetical protein
MSFQSNYAYIISAAESFHELLVSDKSWLPPATELSGRLTQHL